MVFKNVAKRFMAKLVMWSLKEFGLGGGEAGKVKELINQLKKI